MLEPTLLDLPTATYSLRPYQREAVDAGLAYLRRKSDRNGLMILPTGSGKSLVIANLVKELGEPCLVFQPSYEILVQNVAKYRSYGNQCSIYSASAGEKVMSNVTFATIGSVIKRLDKLSRFKYIIIDECHAVNAEGGMYEKLISTLGVRVLGLTATPYRLSNGIDQRTQRGYSILKFLTRTRPRIFEDVVYYVQNRRLFDDGHLSKMVYYPINAIQRQNLQVNSTGSGYTEKSEKAVYRAANMPVRLVKCVNRLIELNRKNGLVFTRFVEEARLVAANIPGAAVVSADTPDKERERVINGFSAGRIRWICNVGILTTGVDFPDLESVVMGRATRSLAQWYQIVGRGVRTHPDKKDCMVIDYGGNYDQFGPVEDLELSDEGGWHIRSQGRGPLTGIPFGDRYVPKRS